MASKIDIPGSGQSIDFSNPVDSVWSFVMAVVAFMLAAAAGSAGVWLYNNVVAQNTPNQLSEVNLD